MYHILTLDLLLVNLLLRLGALAWLLREVFLAEPGPAKRIPSWTINAHGSVKLHF